MAYSKETRDKARGLFVSQRYAIPVIAVALNVAQGTVARWKAGAKSQGDDWDVARAAATMQGEGFDRVVAEAVEGFTVMFQATIEQIKQEENLSPAGKAKLMAALADSFQKMINAAGRASPKLSKLAIAMEILTMLSQFVREEFPQHGEAFEEMLTPFGHKVSGAFTK